AVRALTEAELEAERLAGERDLAEQEVARVESAWGAWKQAEGVPPELGPQGVLDLFEAVRETHAALAARRAAVARHTELTVGVEAWAERARAALGAAGVEAPIDDDELSAAVVALRERCLAEA